jgi:hypothetical protein
LWIGGLWTIGFIVAPTLFKQLPDAKLAGTLAGILFNFMGWLGLLCTLLLVVIYVLLKSARWRFWVLSVIALLINFNLFYLSPEIAQLRESAGGALIKGTEQYQHFALIHGLASGLYLVISLLGLLLVVRQHEKSLSP